MSELDFTLVGIEPTRHAAAPHLLFRIVLEQRDPSPVPIRNILLHVQIRFDPHLRSYDALSRERLFELFGAEEQWSRTLHSMLWTHVDFVVPRFSRRTIVELPVPCSFDFNIAATRYFDGMHDGTIPLRLLFSGTIFESEEGGPLQIGLVPWEKEATGALPVRVWKDMMDLYYPNSAWLRLDKDVFDRLLEFRRRCGAATWEGVLTKLLESAAVGSPR